jgi:3-hydroxyisobutyrate dehydrogenase-like beta-hydroxyacid dehydrogenase
MDKNQRQDTIGILYPGEMGASFGKLLCDAGFRVVTTTEGRSVRTHRLCREAGLSVLGSLDDVIKHSDTVMSLVSPGAACSVARDVAARMKDSSRSLVYIDANSISPMTVTEIAEALRDVPVDFVDASIFGLASQLRQRGMLYLSGPRAKEISNQFGALLRVKAVGDMPGAASALKMIVSGIPKGLSALFIETMLLAQCMNLLGEAREACDEIYPSIMEVINRMIPTYPQHAGRRSEELKEVEETMLMSGVTPRILAAVRELTAALAGINWPDHDHQQWTIAEVIEQIHEEGILQLSRSPFPQFPKQNKNEVERYYPV